MRRATVRVAPDLARRRSVCTQTGVAGGEPGNCRRPWAAKRWLGWDLSPSGCRWLSSVTAVSRVWKCKRLGALSLLSCADTCSRPRPGVY